MSSNVVVIAGPTASGKSWLGARLAQRMNGVVINADSQQLYNALPILTAQPGPELTGLAPHRLYGVIDPTASSTAAWWAKAARHEIAEAQGQGLLPILVGGTGLYLEALMHGMAAIPEIPPDARIAAQSDLDSMGREAFYARLVAADPASKLLAIGDTQRILRAWEVFSATGRPLSAWQRLAADKPSDLNFHSVLILPSRENQIAACDRRFVDMIDRGAVGEVESFLQHYEAAAPAARALGFAALAEYLKHSTTLDEAIAKAQAQTRQYAKRQATWFRNRFQRTTLYPAIFDSVDDEILFKVLNHLRSFNHI